jgi:hypothetical protein
MRYLQDMGCGASVPPADTSQPGAQGVNTRAVLTTAVKQVGKAAEGAVESEAGQQLVGEAVRSCSCHGPAG